MAETEQTLAADTQALFDAAGVVSTPESRQKAKDKLAKAAARMTPEKWAALREAHRAPRTA